MRKPIVVRSTLDLQQAIAAGYDIQDITVHTQEVDQIEQAARQSGYEAGYNAGRSEAVVTAAGALSDDVLQAIASGERARIQAIQAITEPGLEGVARAAIAEGISAEAFAYRQMTEIKDRGITLGAMRADAPPVAQFSAAPLYEAPARGKRAATADNVYARRREAART